MKSQYDVLMTSVTRVGSSILYFMRISALCMTKIRCSPSLGRPHLLIISCMLHMFYFFPVCVLSAACCLLPASLHYMQANPTTADKSVLNDLAFSPDGQFLFITDTW